MSTINQVTAASFTLPSVTSSTTASSPTSVSQLSPQDLVELSDAGRIALGVSDGKLTSVQGQQLDSQLETLQQTQPAQFGQLQSQISQQIYGDTHNGATLPTDPTLSPATDQDFFEAGRVALQESAGNLTSTQGSQFLSQISQIYEQSQNGASASATTQAQGQLSTEIYDAAHDITSGT